MAQGWEGRPLLAMAQGCGGQPLLAITRLELRALGLPPAPPLSPGSLLPGAFERTVQSSWKSPPACPPSAYTWAGTLTTPSRPIVHRSQARLLSLQGPYLSE